MLTRAEHIALMIATTLCSALALWGLFTAPEVARCSVWIDGSSRSLCPAFLGMLAGTLVSLHMARWGLNLILKGVRRRGAP
jgi:hypothetical protein